jgi:4-hydroxyphenylpyruvate dioxygenase
VNGDIANLFGLGTVCLGGDLPSKLNAIRDAGGNCAEIWYRDLDGQSEAAVRAALKGKPGERELAVLNMQPIHQFDGHPTDTRADARTHAAAVLSWAQHYSAKAVLVCASTHLRTDKKTITQDLRELAGWAWHQYGGLEVWFEGLPWSRVDRDLPAAYQRVLEVDRPNFKLVIDTFHDALCGGDPRYVRGIDPAHVGLVQLSDLRHEPTVETVIDTARQHRVPPGDGYMTRHATDIVDVLLENGYGGPFTAEVMNRRLKATDPHTAAHKIMTALGRVAPIWS